MPRVKRHFYILLVACALTLPAGAQAVCHRLFPVPHEWSGSGLHHSASISPRAAKTYAIFILGGAAGRAAAQANYPAFWNNISFGYQVLTTKGVPAENMRILLGAGPGDDTVLTSETGMPPTYGADREAVVRAFRPYPHDFDCDSLPDVSGPATVEGLRAAVQSLAPRMNPGSQLLIYYVGHGMKPSVFPLLPFRVTLWNSELLPHQLESALSQVPQDVRVALMTETCYGGHFLRLARKQGRCVLTSAPADSEAYFRRRTEYGFVTELFFSALLGARAYSAAYPPMLTPEYFLTEQRPEPSLSQTADFDRNGVVTAQEAFRYTRMHYTRSVPQIEGAVACTGFAL